MNPKVSLPVEKAKFNVPGSNVSLLTGEVFPTNFLTKLSFA